MNQLSERFQITEEEGESSIASVEEQLRKEMTVYEVCFLRSQECVEKKMPSLVMSFISSPYTNQVIIHLTPFAVLQKFIIGMLTNFGSMTLDRIHNTLKAR